MLTLADIGPVYCYLGNVLRLEPICSLLTYESSGGQVTTAKMMSINISCLFSPIVRM